MTQDEAYEFIGKLAIALYAQGVQISLDSLQAILSDADRENEYAGGRGMASRISAAFEYWQRKGDPVIPAAIAHTYTDKHGKLAWQ